MPPSNARNEDEVDLNSKSYENIPGSDERLPGWIKVGAIAAASALLGGLAATWVYRKTLSRLRQADQNPHDSDFGIKDERTDSE